MERIPYLSVEEIDLRVLDTWKKSVVDSAHPEIDLLDDQLYQLRNNRTYLGNTERSGKFLHSIRIIEGTISFSNHVISVAKEAFKMFQKITGNSEDDQTHLNHHLMNLQVNLKLAKDLFTSAVQEVDNCRLILNHHESKHESYSSPSLFRQIYHLERMNTQEYDQWKHDQRGGEFINDNPYLVGRKEYFDNWEKKIRAHYQFDQRHGKIQKTLDQIYPPFKLKDLEIFEKQNQIYLPIELKYYLTHISRKIMVNYGSTFPLYYFDENYVNRNFYKFGLEEIFFKEVPPNMVDFCQNLTYTTEKDDQIIKITPEDFFYQYTRFQDKEFESQTGKQDPKDQNPEDQNPEDQNNPKHWIIKTSLVNYTEKVQQPERIINHRIIECQDCQIILGKDPFYRSKMDPDQTLCKSCFKWATKKSNQNQNLRELRFELIGIKPNAIPNSYEDQYCHACRQRIKPESFKYCWETQRYYCGKCPKSKFMFSLKTYSDFYEYPDHYYQPPINEKGLTIYKWFDKNCKDCLANLDQMDRDCPKCYLNLALDEPIFPSTGKKCSGCDKLLVDQIIKFPLKIKNTNDTFKDHFYFQGCEEQHSHQDFCPECSIETIEKIHQNKYHKGRSLWKNQYLFYPKSDSDSDRDSDQELDQISYIKQIKCADNFLEIQTQEEKERENEYRLSDQTNRQIWNGHITISDFGCGETDKIIVDGPNRGKVHSTFLNGLYESFFIYLLSAKYSRFS